MGRDTSGKRQKVSNNDKTTLNFQPIIESDVVTLIENIADEAIIDAVQATTLQMANPILLPTGTAAVPSIGFTADHTTGLYRAAGNTIGLSTNGVNRLSVSNTFVTVNTGFSSTYQGYFGGQLIVGAATDSTDSTTGCFVTTGGIGIGKNINCDGDINCGGDINCDTINFGGAALKTYSVGGSNVGTSWNPSVVDSSNMSSITITNDKYFKMGCFVYCQAKVSATFTLGGPSSITLSAPGTVTYPMGQIWSNDVALTAPIIGFCSASSGNLKFFIDVSVAFEGSHDCYVSALYVDSSE